MAAAMRMCSPVEMRRCLASRWRPSVPTNTPVNGVVSELRVEQGLSSSNSSYLDGFSLELTMRVLSVYKRQKMQELRVAEEGEEPDADALASIVRNQPSDSEEECSEHSLCYANVSERVSEEPEGRVPVSFYEDLLMEAAAQEAAEEAAGGEADAAPMPADDEAQVEMADEIFPGVFDDHGVPDEHDAMEVPEVADNDSVYSSSSSSAHDGNDENEAQIGDGHDDEGEHVEHADEGVQMPPAHDDTAYHTEGVDHIMLGWYANLYPTMRIKKMLPDFVPYPHCWQVDGSCAPIRKSVSFLCGPAPAAVTVYLWKSMKQTIILERGLNVISWDRCRTFADVGGHTAPENADSYYGISFETDSQHKWELVYPSNDGGGVVPAQDPLDIVETWDTLFPPNKLIVVTPESEPHSLESLCRSTLGDHFVWAYMRRLSLPMEPSVLRTTFYDLYEYPRFIHPLDVGPCVELPVIPRNF